MGEQLTRLKDKKGKQTRQKILEASLELFARQGFHKTSITQIVAASGSYRSAIEWHFGGKDGLLLAVLDYYFEQKFIQDIKGRWENFLGTPHSFDGNSVFSFFFKEIMDLLQANLGISLALFTLTFEQMHQDQKVGERVQRAWARIIETFTWVVELGQKDGLIEPSADPGALARNIIALGQGLFMQWYLNPSDEIARQNIAHFLQGLKTYLKIPVPEKPEF